MGRVVSFHVPGAGPDDAEQTYRALAEFAEVDPAEPSDRIRLVHFRHDAQEWTAEVGATLTGEEDVTSQRQRQRDCQRFIPPPPRVRRLDDAAVVLAIFSTPGAYRVVTNEAPVGRRLPLPLGEPIHDRTR